MIYTLSTEPSKNKSNHAESSKHTARGEVEAANKLREFVRYGSPGSLVGIWRGASRCSRGIVGRRAGRASGGCALDSDHSIKQSAVVSAISRPYLLLAGSSLENILKGLIVAREPRHATSLAVF